MSASTESANKRVGVIATLAMIGSAACWGFATVMSRDLLNSFTAPLLLVVQLIASVLTLLLLSMPHKPWRYISPSLGRASLTGILEPGLTYSVGLWGLSLTSAGSASIIGSTEPIFILVLAWIIFKEKPSANLFACILFAVTGLLLVSYDSATSNANKSLAGDLLIVLSTLFAASYVVLSAKWANRFPAAVLASSQQFIGLMCAISIYIAGTVSGMINQSIFEVRLGTIIYASLSGIIQYALAFWLYLIGLKYLRPGAAGLWLTLIPVFGVAGAFIWLGEVPTVTMLAGMVLIVVAVYAGRKEQ
ncbi:hypothetical protein AXK12_05755 [Cephaloticoccus capnophilus]|uniref:EamA domain-containing protein n=1 Tax=Cephaloticoccus capnophilus TaxID=1548208 RepID=A0A139SKW1_9BACT|nr:DMT family transporter [Cephaloticoccus capnophilus]KXU35208.1 hypothetical protein AXK12_05755 [Cephaloticoccus capnophilus]